MNEKILRNCANRDSVPQFFNNVYDSTCSYYNGRVEISNQDFLGIVLDYDDNTKIATIEQRNYFKKGDSGTSIAIIGTFLTCNFMGYESKTGAKITAVTIAQKP